MDPRLLAEILRGALAGLSLVREWRKNASADQLTAFVGAIHASGGSVDLNVVDGVLQDVQAGQAALEQQIKDAGG